MPAPVWNLHSCNSPLTGEATFSYLPNKLSQLVKEPDRAKSSAIIHCFVSWLSYVTIFYLKFYYVFNMCITFIMIDNTNTIKSPVKNKQIMNILLYIPFQFQVFSQLPLQRRITWRVLPRLFVFLKCSDNVTGLYCHMRKMRKVFLSELVWHRVLAIIV